MSNLIVNIGLYRHFKGAYYFVQNIIKDAVTDELMCYYFNILHPEYGFFVRSVNDWFTKDTEKGLIKDRLDNVTGQEHRFEKIVSIDNYVENLTTRQLLYELRKRTDCPIHELDLDGLYSDVFAKDYVIGEKHYKTEDFPQGVSTQSVFSTPQEAFKCLAKHPNSRYGVFKRTFIEVKM